VSTLLHRAKTLPLVARERTVVPILRSLHPLVFAPLTACTDHHMRASWSERSDVRERFVEFEAALQGTSVRLNPPGRLATAGGADGWFRLCLAYEAFVKANGIRSMKELENWIAPHLNSLGPVFA